MLTNHQIVHLTEMQGKYTVVFDPLTGLSDPPAPDLGAIFGIFYQLSPETPGVSDILQPARNLVAAGYVLYSRCTTLMFSAGEGLHRFTLDSSMNEFILTQRNVRMPFYGNTYSINEGYAQQFDEATADCVKHLKTEPSLDGTPRTFRYIGSMVADIHRTISLGGIYMYPRTKQHPDGKLKLLYEAGPVAWLMSQAGGQASTGKQAIVNITPDCPHTRVPFFAGSEDEVALAAGFYADTPFGPVHKDPMWKLRRKHSIEQKSAQVKKGIKTSSEDGIVCAHLGVSA